MAGFSFAPVAASRALDQTLPAAPARVLRADRLFTGASPQTVPQGAVAIADGFVVWSGPAAALPAEYAGWLTDDYGDATLLPGLVETHAHLAAYEKAVQPDVPAPETHKVAWETLSSVKIARQLASLGVTAVQSLGAADYTDVALREAIRAGLVPGPRLVAAGPAVTLTAGHGWRGGAAADSIPELLRQVRFHHQAGADLVKVMATGGFMSHSTAPWNAQFTLAELLAIADDAHRLGHHAAVHAHGTEGIRRAVRAGFDFIAHCSFVDADGRTAFDPQLADEIAQRGVFVDSSAVPAFPVVPGQPAAALAKQLYDHGVLLVIGHDIGAVTSAAAYRHGLSRLAEAGLPTAEILLAATSRGAAAVGLSGVVGVLEPGYQADLIVVGGNPLANLAALDDIREVVIGGRRFDRETVPPWTPPVGNAGSPEVARQAWLDRQSR
ncbi:MAG: amidohydrolase family protein [Propionibacteriaceae bacterium]|jgi:imidazolonepropionase-like amidohydrolase|nr:amidohydrolase family protein [Propionibacteriaceae bacterium]